MALRMFKGTSLPRVKDKFGNNIKQHFGMWKYFIDTKTMQRSKFYISLDCERLDGRKAVERSKLEKDQPIGQALRKI